MFKTFVLLGSSLFRPQVNTLALQAPTPVQCVSLSPLDRESPALLPRAATQSSHRCQALPGWNSAFRLRLPSLRVFPHSLQSLTQFLEHASLCSFLLIFRGKSPDLSEVSLWTSLIDIKNSQIIIINYNTFWKGS